LDTVQELEGLVTKQMSTLNSEYSTKDARQAFAAHTMGELTPKQAKALVHGDAAVARVQDRS
jgi:hypothetical protein